MFQIGWINQFESFQSLTLLQKPNWREPCDYVALRLFGRTFFTSREWKVVKVVAPNAHLLHQRSYLDLEMFPRVGPILKSSYFNPKMGARVGPILKIILGTFELFKIWSNLCFSRTNNVSCNPKIR